MARGHKGGKGNNKNGKQKNQKQKQNASKNVSKKNQETHLNEKVNAIRPLHLDPTEPYNSKLVKIDEIISEIKRVCSAPLSSLAKEPAKLKQNDGQKKIGMTKAQLQALQEKEAKKNPPPPLKEPLRRSTSFRCMEDEEQLLFSDKENMDDGEDEEEEEEESFDDETNEETDRDDEEVDETEDDLSREEEGTPGNKADGGSEEDYSDTANENPNEYRKGGYHPVHLGEVYNTRYRVLQKLGWGCFSTVWLVWDYRMERFQAMKVQRSASHYTSSAMDEIELLSEIKSAEAKLGTPQCAQLNDFFNHQGPNGLHVCMVFDAYGENLLMLIERYEYHGIPLPIVKCITRQVLLALNHIHSVRIIHTDLKPENVLLSSPKHSIASLMRRYSPPPLQHVVPLTEKDIRAMTKSQRRRYFKKMAKVKEKQKMNSDGLNPEYDSEVGRKNMKGGDESEGEAKSGEEESSNFKNEKSDTEASSVTDEELEVERFHHVVLADFGNSCWVDKQFSSDVQTRQYRSPEVILREPYGTPIDIWSLACMVFELLTGDFLFNPRKGENYPRDEDHLALFTELLGKLPAKMRFGSGEKVRKFYDSNGEFLHIKKLECWSLENLLREKYRFKPKKAKEIAEFLLPMLEYDPEKRASAEHMLSVFSSFFVVEDDDYEPREKRRRKTKKSENEEDEDEENGDESRSEGSEEENSSTGSEATCRSESQSGSNNTGEENGPDEDEE